MKKEFKSLIGFEGSVIELSNELIKLGCEDICEFGNWDEIIEGNDVVVSTDNEGENHIQIFFTVEIYADEYERIEASIIKIKNIEKF